MTATTYQEPKWDRANRRFEQPLRCPYPDCGQPVSPSHADAALAWCNECERPYEAVRHRPERGPEPIELMRRPQAAFCTFTGKALPGFSLLDWAEAGGGPGRAHCLPDDKGAVFGPPNGRTAFTLEEGWACASILDQEDQADFVTSVSVVRGQVVAVSARGRIGIFDAFTGEPRLERVLDWPDRSAEPLDPFRAVRQAPAFRGTFMVLAAPHQAQFRALKSFLLGAEAERRPRTVEPDSGAYFLGPPLGLDVDGRSYFCLLQGQRGDRVEGGLLRLFDLEGNELARQATGAIARPPVFDRGSGFLAWVDGQAAVSAIRAEALLGSTAAEVTTSRPDPLLHLETIDRPTLVAAPDGQGRTELWMGTEAGGKTVLYHTLLQERLSHPEANWSWDQRDLGKVGPLNGLAVGIGSRFGENVAGQQIAISTPQQAARLERYSSSATTFSMKGSDSHGTPGSFDPPVLCSAGAIARVQGKICLDNQLMGWSSEVFQPSVSVPGIYNQAQGIALFGRQVFIGHGLGVLSYRLRKERRG